MKQNKTYETKFRRRREGKTDYAKRLAMVKSKTTRVVIRKTNTQILANAVNFNPKGDETIASANSKEINKYGFYGTNNTPSAYLTGFLLGKKMSGKTDKAILDIGRKSPSHGSVIFACLKGLSDAGVNIAYSKEAVPSDDRLTGKTLDVYAKANPDKFSKYTKTGINPGEIEAAFNKAKAEIDKIKLSITGDKGSVKA